MKKLLFCILAAIVVLGLSRPAGAGPITFSDGTFVDANWTESMIVDTGPTPGTFSVGQVGTNGNPDEYRQLQHFWSGPGNIVTAHLRNGAVYDPSSQGSISSLFFSYDLILFNGGSSNAVNYSGLVFQNGSFYLQSPTGIGPILDQWESQTVAGLVALDFSLVSGSGPAIPDFSMSGSLIQFGYLASNGRSYAGSTSTVSGIDNWSVSVQTVPEPSTVVILGIGLAGLAGVGARRKLKKRAIDKSR